MESEVRRVGWIDEVRGFAIILVIAGHAIGGLSSEIGGGADNILHIAIYCFHMPLLFMVSGLVAHENKWEGVKDFKNRIFRMVISLYIPYLLWSYLFWAVRYFIYSGNTEVGFHEGIMIF